MTTIASQDTATFIVRLVPTDPKNLKTFATSNPEREEFWRSTAQIDPDKVDLDIDLCESRFLQTFATRLRDTLTARLRMRDGTLEDRGTQHQQLNLHGSKRVRLTIESHEYGSLEAKILVEGATAVAAAFSGRMNLFSAFIEHYTPQAFVASLPIDPVSDRPVSATIRADDDFQNGQFKAVLDELAKRKSLGLRSTASPSQWGGPGNSATSTPSHLQSQQATAATTATPAPTPQSQPTSSATQATEPKRPVSVKLDANNAQTDPDNIVVQELPNVTLPTLVRAAERASPIEGEISSQVAPQIIFIPQHFPSSTPIEQHEQNHRSNRLWVVANLSLLFPVLLALVVLYFAYSGLKAERAQLEARHSEIERREKEVQQLMLSREKQLFEAMQQRNIQLPPNPSAPLPKGAVP